MENILDKWNFEDQVPVNIFAGKCQIDFSEIYSYIEFLFEKLVSRRKELFSMRDAARMVLLL